MPIPKPELGIIWRKHHLSLEWKKYTSSMVSSFRWGFTTICAERWSVCLIFWRGGHDLFFIASKLLPVIAPNCHLHCPQGKKIVYWKTNFRLRPSRGKSLCLTFFRPHGSEAKLKLNLWIVLICQIK
jgi:hypothetical protein